MTKILFTCHHMNIGGVQKSLISLLKNIDTRDFNIDLFLEDVSGELLVEIPEGINIFQLNLMRSMPKFTRKSFLRDIKYIIKHPEFSYSFIKAGLVAIKDGSKMALHEYWNTNKDNFKIDVNNKYDIAISYAGGIDVWNQFIIDKVNAKKKIAWIHGDYSVFGTGTELEKSYLKEFDSIVTVSETSEQILITEIPEIKDKIVVIENIVDKLYINEMANKENIYDEGFKGIRFVSISRLDKGKGFDLAIRAFSRAIQNGYNLKWDIVGEGCEMEHLSLLVKELNLSDRICFVGKKVNPYPYLKEADIFIHPSRSEGKSISVDEAKSMGKPILITDYPTVGDQIQDNITGKIVPITLEGLYSGIIELATNTKLRIKLSENLLRIETYNDSILKFYKLINKEKLDLKNEN